MIRRRVEERSVLFVGEARENLLGQCSRSIQITPLVRRFVGERQSPCRSRIVFEQTGDLAAARDAALGYTLQQKV